MNLSKEGLVSKKISQCHCLWSSVSAEGSSEEASDTRLVRQAAIQCKRADLQVDDDDGAQGQT